MHFGASKSDYFIILQGGTSLSDDTSTIFNSSLFFKGQALLTLLYFTCTNTL